MQRNHKKLQANVFVPIYFHIHIIFTIMYLLPNITIRRNQLNKNYIE
jgi:hypothetical protein